MPSINDLHEEQLRTRDRLHKLENSLHALRLHVATLGENQKRTSDLLDSVADTVQQMSSAEEIREAIADELHKRIGGVWRMLAGGVGIAAVILGAAEAARTVFGV